jgi:hypothetical protein
MFYYYMRESALDNQDRRHRNRRPQPVYFNPQPEYIFYYEIVPSKVGNISEPTQNQYSSNKSNGVDCDSLFEAMKQHITMVSEENKNLKKALDVTFQELKKAKIGL